MGFFSWYTQDTEEPIYNIWQKHSEVFEVHMVNPLTGETFTENSYDGYGEFGGKDFYVLLAELNKDKIGEGLDWNDSEEVRDIGIDLAFSESPNGESKGIVYPILVRDKDKWKDYINCIPVSHEGQGYWINEDCFCDDNEEFDENESVKGK